MCNGSLVSKAMQLGIEGDLHDGQACALILSPTTRGFRSAHVLVLLDSESRATVGVREPEWQVARTGFMERLWAPQRTRPVDAKR